MCVATLDRGAHATTDGAHANEPPSEFQSPEGCQPSWSSLFCHNALSLPIANTSTCSRLEIKKGGGCEAAGMGPVCPPVSDPPLPVSSDMCGTGTGSEIKLMDAL